MILNTYDMQREVPRTLQSMLPPLQRAVDPADYEIIVIDNGTSVPLVLPQMDSGGVDIRLVRIAPEDSRPSPVFALNMAVRDLAKGDAVMLCVDGARMFSPYVISRTMQALLRDPAAFTFVGSRHLGPDVQMRSVHAGYNQQVEDTLLTASGWDSDLDRLFGISVWAGSHSNSDALFQNESNAFAMTKTLWGQHGGYDEGFSRPGGGLCNLEIFNRFVERPDARNILLLGEVTFHQFHGGAATSDGGYFHASIEEFRAVAGYDYRLPVYERQVDKGLEYGRDAALGHWIPF